MKHTVSLNRKQVEDLKLDFLQISFEFSVIMERDGSITVRDEREVLTRKMKSMQGLREFMDLVVPDAKPGDEVVLVLPDGHREKFCLAQLKVRGRPAPRREQRPAMPRRPLLKNTTPRAGGTFFNN